ncbi:MAG: hypothetical protein N2203_07435 [Bacteroidia bacterium]|nr:hypothetical protein [Bacteroidia bacterium]
MIQYLFSFLFVFNAIFLFSQEQSSVKDEFNTKKDEMNCYNKWAAKFEERGAEEVKDGVYTDVIVTVRYKGNATCYSGKVEIIEGKVGKFYILLEDGTYDEFKKTWKNNSNKDKKIINGISETMITIHNELVNILFPSKLKPKKPKPRMAPEPTED